MVPRKQFLVCLGASALWHQKWCCSPRAPQRKVSSCLPCCPSGDPVSGQMWADFPVEQQRLGWTGRASWLGALLLECSQQLWPSLDSWKLAKKLLTKNVKQTLILVRCWAGWGECPESHALGLLFSSPSERRLETPWSLPGGPPLPLVEGPQQPGLNFLACSEAARRPEPVWVPWPESCLKAAVVKTELCWGWKQPAGWVLSCLLGTEPAALCCGLLSNL